MDTAIQPIYIFLNEDLVDEVWTILKRDGIPVEKVREASGKAAAKAKFGLGNIWKWLASDLSMEVVGEVGGKTSQKISYTAFLRALMLPELIPDIYQGTIDFNTFESLPTGTFISIDCEHLSIIPIPTYASFWRQRLLSNIPANDDTDSDNSLIIIEKLTTFQKALTLEMLLHDEDGNQTILGVLWDSLSAEVANALILSNDDLYLLISQVHDASGPTFVISFIEERFLRRNLVGFTGGKPLKFFGQKAYSKELDQGGYIFGLNLLSVALT